MTDRGLVGNRRQSVTVPQRKRGRRTGRS